MLVLAVEEDQVGEGLAWEWRVVQQEVELLEASGGLLLDVHKCRVVKGHGIELVFVSWGHVHQGFSSSSWVLHGVLDGGFQVEGFDQCGFFERLSVAN